MLKGWFTNGKAGVGGSIVTVGDWAVDRPYPGYLAYFLSKAGIESATKALAVELASMNSKIRVNCIHQGIFSSQMI